MCKINDMKHDKAHSETKTVTQSLWNDLHSTCSLTYSKWHTHSRGKRITLRNVTVHRGLFWAWYVGHLVPHREARRWFFKCQQRSTNLADFPSLDRKPSCWLQEEVEEWFWEKDYEWLELVGILSVTCLLQKSLLHYNNKSYFWVRYVGVKAPSVEECKVTSL